VEKDPNDGSFFMSWKDYEKYFGTINICQLNPIYLHSSLRMVCNRRKSNYVQMKVTAGGNYSVFICQENERKFQAKRSYSAARLILSRKS
jgi:DNA gyrase inhibitor GyrI